MRGGGSLQSQSCIYGLSIFPIFFWIGLITSTTPSEDDPFARSYYGDEEASYDNHWTPRDGYYDDEYSKSYDEYYDGDLAAESSDQQQNQQQYYYPGGNGNGNGGQMGGGQMGGGPLGPPMGFPGGHPPPFGFPDPGFKTQTGFEGFLVPNSWYGLLPWGIEGVVIVIAGIIVFVIIVIAIIGLLAWLCGIKKVISPNIIKKEEEMSSSRWNWREEWSQKLTNISSSVYSAFDKFGGVEANEFEVGESETPPD